MTDRERIDEITRRTNAVLSLSPLDRSPVGEWPEMVRDALDALADAEAENARLREFAEWCVSLDQFESVTLAPIVERARAALASRPGEEQACERCHGDGVVTVGGASVNPHTDALGPDPQAAEDVTCPDCGGTGEEAAT